MPQKHCLQEFHLSPIPPLLSGKAQKVHRVGCLRCPSTLGCRGAKGDRWLPRQGKYPVPDNNQNQGVWEAHSASGNHGAPRHVWESIRAKRQTDKLHSWRLSEADNRTVGSARQICVGQQASGAVFSSVSILFSQYPFRWDWPYLLAGFRTVPAEERQCKQQHSHKIRHLQSRLQQGSCRWNLYPKDQSVCQVQGRQLMDTNKKACHHERGHPEIDGIGDRTQPQNRIHPICKGHLPVLLLYGRHQLYGYGHPALWGHCGRKNLLLPTQDPEAAILPSGT